MQPFRMQKRLLHGLAFAGCLVLLASASVATGSAAPVFLDQGWSPELRQRFYTTPQGSQLIPYRWFMALESPSSETRFAADGLARFGYLANPRSAANPDGLPVGFVLERYAKKEWLGLTCAACHTGQIEFAGQTLQIDGGPAGADVFRFLEDLGQAVAATERDPQRFARFAHRVLGQDPGAGAEARLRADLKEFTGSYTTFIKDSTPDHAWGPARADAFGMIFNRVASINLKIPANSQKPNAPVGYPFLWDTSWHDRVQWSGSAPNNLAVERLARNVGQVLGVFAKIDLRNPPPGAPYYVSTANRTSLLVLEDWVSRLRSPAWPEGILGTIDPVKAAAGKALYARNCASCHAVVSRDQPNRRINVVMDPLASIRTDPAMVMTVLTRQADTGALEGVREKLLFGEPLRKREPVGRLVRHAALGAILAPLRGADLEKILRLVPKDETQLIRWAIILRAAGGTPRTAAEARVRQRFDTTYRRLAAKPVLPSTQAYKARSLNGIWATAPYLPNGSVANLYELLLPEGQRKAKFTVGSREFDPKGVGFKTDPFPGGFEFDTALAGNRNTGHSGPRYGTELTDEERWQLVEYLKTL